MKTLTVGVAGAKPVMLWYNHSGAFGRDPKLSPQMMWDHVLDVCSDEEGPRLCVRSKFYELGSSFVVQGVPRAQPAYGCAIVPLTQLEHGKSISGFRMRCRLTGWKATSPAIFHKAIIAILFRMRPGDESLEGIAYSRVGEPSGLAVVGSGNTGLMKVNGYFAKGANSPLKALKLIDTSEFTYGILVMITVGKDEQGGASYFGASIDLDEP